jgi:integrase
MPKLKFVNGIAKNPGGQGYYIRWYEYELDENNRKVSIETKHFFEYITTIADAQKKRKELIQEAKTTYKRAIVYNVQNMTLAEFFFSEFIKNKAGQDRVTVGAYQSDFRYAAVLLEDGQIQYNHRLSKVLIKNLPDHKFLIQDYIDEISKPIVHGGMGLSKRTAQKAYTILYSCFNWAVGRQVWDKNPMGTTGIDKIEVPKTEQAKRISRRRRSRNNQTFSPNILKAIVENLNDENLKILVQICAGAGLRRQEALALRWCDIDFYDEEVPVLYIEQTVRQVKADKITGAPYLRFDFRDWVKGYGTGLRTPLHKQLVSVLINHKNIQQEQSEGIYKWSEDSLVFSHNIKWNPEPAIFHELAGHEPTDWVKDINDGIADTGTPLRGDYFQKNLTKASAKAGRPDINVRTLRHIFKSVLSQAKINPTQQADFMGHTNIDTGHLYYDDQQSSNLKEYADIIGKQFEEGV